MKRNIQIRQDDAPKGWSKKDIYGRPEEVSKRNYTKGMAELASNTRMDLMKDSETLDDELENHAQVREKLNNEYKHEHVNQEPFDRDFYDKSYNVASAIIDAQTENNNLLKSKKDINDALGYLPNVSIEEGTHLRTLDDENTDSSNDAQGVTIDELSKIAEEKCHTERVNHPDYYNLKDGPYLVVDGKKIPIECIDVIRDMPTWKGNVIKYLWRCGEKTEEGISNDEKEIEDMEKAEWYLHDKINNMKLKKR